MNPSDWINSATAWLGGAAGILLLSAALRWVYDMRLYKTIIKLHAQHNKTNQLLKAVLWEMRRAEMIKNTKWKVTRR